MSRITEEVKQTIALVNQVADTHDNSNAEGLDRAASHELHELCTRLYDGVISDGEMARLDQLLESSSSARACYFRYVGLHSALLTSTGKHQREEAEQLRRHITKAAQCEEDALKQDSLELPLRTRLRGASQRSFITWAVSGTLAAAALITVLWILQRPEDPFVASAQGDRSEQQAATPADANMAAAPVQLSYVSPTTRWRQRAGSF